MSIERVIKRYSAYYAGWCVAFGEHEIAYEENRDIQWIFGEEKVGITLAPKLLRRFVRELLGKHEEMPRIVLYSDSAKINHLEFEVSSEADRQSLAQFRRFFDCPDEIHMFLSSHFCYPPGTRIVTFSKKKPLVIMYKEIEPLKLIVD